MVIVRVVMMGSVLVFLDLFRRDVPAAIVAGWGLFVAGIAQERAALEVLFEAGLIVRREIARIARQG
jgi:peptidoglycan biosynthesis protein MviN/MurJ (putative lipid II flippase)